MKRGISPNNTKHKQKASILVSTSIVQISSITSEQSPEDFCFEIILGLALKQANVGWELAAKSIKSKTTPQQSLLNFRTSIFETNCQK